MNCHVPKNLKLWNANGGLVVTSSVGPGGGTEASSFFPFELTEPDVEGEFYLDWFFSDASAKGQIFPLAAPFAISALFKANGRAWAWLDAGDGDVDRFAYFDIENGVQGVTSGPDVTSTIESIGDGWFRCTLYSVSKMSDEYGVPDNSTVSLGPANEDGAFGYLGKGSGVLVAGVRFDAPGAEQPPAV